MNAPQGLPKSETMTEWSAMLERVIENTKALSPDASAELLDRAIAACPDGKGRGLNAALERQTEKLAKLLPGNLKDQAERFVKIAMLTFEKRAELRDCTPASFLKCVFEAAQYGFAIDGRLFHAVKRNRNAARRNEPENWIAEAHCMPDYKGLIAVAKRAGAILECEARVVAQSDDFELYFEDGATRMRHRPDLTKTVKPDSFKGVYCRLWLSGSPGWICEYMSAEEVRAICGRSESMKPRKGRDPSGPWITDFFEMAKKTVLKRAMKTRVDDPAFTQLLELDDREYEPDPNAPVATGTPIRATDDSPMARLTASLPPAPGEESFTVGTEPATEQTEVTPPQPSTAADAGPSQDEANLDALNNALAGCESPWDVDAAATDFVGVFQTQEARDRAKEMHRAAKVRTTPAIPEPKPKARKTAQKTMVDTTPQYD